MNLTWISALSIGFAADVFVAVGLVLFVRADRKYQVEKAARLQAMGLYRPEFVYQPQPVIACAEVTVLEPAPAEPKPVQLPIISEVRAITAGSVGGE